MPALTARTMLPLLVAVLTGLALPAGAADKTLGTIERFDPALDALIGKDAEIEILASGFTWTEGPVWRKDKTGGHLLFSDIPRNSIFRWKEGEGISLFMQPSGYTGVTYYGLEPGCNGLLLDPQGRLVMCEHGDRRVSVLTENGGKMTLADRFNGKRLNSPNDGVYHSNGDLYFTDPPYGLPERENDPRREQDFFGVYRLSKDGKVSVLTKEMTRPNGIAFSADGKTLYVAQSDPEQAIWKAFPVNEDGNLGKSRVFFDVTEHVGDRPGLPDGLKVDAKGNLFASGPGGIYIFSPEAKLLGFLNTGNRTSNCGWGEDGSTLYITVHMHICRIRTKTKGAGW